MLLSIMHQNDTKSTQITGYAQVYYTYLKSKLRGQASKIIK
jgi:hypothetical protein